MAAFFWNALKKLGRVFGREAEETTAVLVSSIERESVVATRSLLESFATSERWFDSGLEGVEYIGSNGSRTSAKRIANLLREGDVRELGRAIGNERLANATQAEIEAVRSSLRRDGVVDVFLREENDFTSATKRVLDSTDSDLGNATRTEGLSEADRTRLDKVSTELEKLREGRSSLVGTTIKLAAGVTLFAVLEEMTAARNGCWISQTLNGVVTSYKLVNDRCSPVVESPFYSVAPESITKTLISPLYKLQELKSNWADIESETKQPVPDKDSYTNENDYLDAAENYLKEFSDIVTKKAPNILQPLTNPPPFCSSSDRCFACDPSSPSWSRHFLTSNNDSLKIHCIKNSTIIGTLASLAGSSAKEIIDNIIPGGTDGIVSTFSKMKVFFIIIAIILACVVVVIILSKIDFKRVT